MKIPVNFPKPVYVPEKIEKPVYVKSEYGYQECPEEGKCPVCKRGRLIRIYTIRIGGETWTIFPELGCIYECDICGRYFRYNPDTKKFEEIPYLQLVREMREVIDFLKSSRYQLRQAISPELAPLTYPDPVTKEHWSIEEVIEACRALGFDPAQVTSAHTPWIKSWLRKHYPRKSK